MGGSIHISSYAFCEREMMSTVAEESKVKPAGNGRPAETIITYIPLGETEEIHLTISRMKLIVCQPTRSGALPNDGQILKFMLMCKAGGLNPYVGDAYLTGYDTKDGPQFSLITAMQSLLKRAEASPEFDGIEQGVVILRGDQITERAGDLILNGETLIGGWARVHRRDRKVPSYDAVNLTTFNQGRSRWEKDPAGMIVKCAMASALRTAFPSTLAAMYCREELDAMRDSRDAAPHVDTRSKSERLTERLVPAITHEQTEPAFVPHTSDDQRQTEPATSKSQAKRQEAQQQEENPEPDSRVAQYQQQIKLAEAPSDLDFIEQTAKQDRKDKKIDNFEFGQIDVMLKEARERVKPASREPGDDQ